MTIRPDLPPPDMALTPMKPLPIKPRSDWGIVRRLARDYMGRQWPLLALSIVCMLITAAMSGELAGIINPAIKKIFLQKHAADLYIIPLEIMAVIIVRAIASFGEQFLTNTIAER